MKKIQLTTLFQLVLSMVLACQFFSTDALLANDPVFKKGLKAHKQGKCGKAIPLLRTIVITKRKIPIRSSAIIHVADCYLKMKKKARALKSINALIKLNKSSLIDHRMFPSQSVYNLYIETMSKGTKKVATSTPKRKTKGAFVKVTSNVDAAVYIDRKPKGKTGQTIKVKGRKVLIELKANGFQDAIAFIKVRRGTLNKLHLPMRQTQGPIAPMGGPYYQGVAQPYQGFGPPAAPEYGTDSIQNPQVTSVDIDDRYNRPPNRAGKEPIIDEVEPESEADYSLLNLLPFGLSQYAAGRSLMGTVFAGSGLLTLFYYSKFKSSSEALQTNLANYKQQRANEASSLSGESQAKHINETNQVIAINEDNIAKKNQNQNLMLVGFLGTWVWSIYDAAHNNNPSKPQPKRRGRRSTEIGPSILENDSEISIGAQIRVRF